MEIGEGVAMAKKIKRYKRFSKTSLETHKSTPNPQGMRELGYSNHAERLRRGIDVILPSPMKEIQAAIDLNADSPRLQVMDRLWQGQTRGQKVIPAYQINIKKQDNHFLILHVSGERCFFSEGFPFQGVYKKSIVYQSRDIAMARYRQDRICWIEVVRIPVSPTPDGG